MNSTLKKPLFPLGPVLATPGALAALGDEPLPALNVLRAEVAPIAGHMAGDDDFAVTRDLRIFSAYILPRTKVKIWVITEADRSATTLLLPHEY